MPRFVIQKHAATHLHYDFRLSIGGVLKSWAIPKEPPRKAGEKRLAVRVEDHALSYINFEGTIPKGSYGAGIVRIWDKGTFKMLKKNENELEFELKGRKLKGAYLLIRFKRAGPKSWLFFKRKAS